MVEARMTPRKYFYSMFQWSRQNVILGGMMELTFA